MNATAKLSACQLLLVALRTRLQLGRMSEVCLLSFWLPSNPIPLISSSGENFLHCEVIGFHIVQTVGRNQRVRNCTHRGEVGAEETLLEAGPDRERDDQLLPGVLPHVDGGRDEQAPAGQLLCRIGAVGRLVSTWSFYIFRFCLNFTHLDAGSAKSVTIRGATSEQAKKMPEWNKCNVGVKII